MNYVRIYDDKNKLNEQGLPEKLHKYLGDDYIVEFYTVKNNNNTKMYSSKQSDDRLTKDDWIFVLCDILWENLDDNKDKVKEECRCLFENVGVKGHICLYTTYGDLEEQEKAVREFKIDVGDEKVFDYAESIMISESMIIDWCARMAETIKITRENDNNE